MFLNYLKKLIIRHEGGQLYSLTLRKDSLKRNVEVGLYSYGYCFDPTFNLGGGVIVGKYCSIASDVHYFGANHPLSFISTSAIFYNKSFSGFDVKDIERKHLTIGNDVWIGHGALILAGCNSIGNGAIIGAGSIVTKNVPPYAVVAGNPAKIIKFRFNEETIKKLENTRWWELSPTELMNYYDVMNDPLSFCNIFETNKITKRLI